MSTQKQTPLMRQYFQIKDKHPGTILLFRVGDFYETFSDDAVLVSEELGITLTKRNNGGDLTPLAGFPFHALETYLPRLVKKGHRVAVCEQTENPEAAKKAGKKIVSREVTEITTPGITMSENLLDHKRNNYIAAVYLQGGTAGVAFSDISTGEFGLTQVGKSELATLLQGISPSEVLVPKGLKKTLPERLDSLTTTFLDDWIYEGDYGYKQLIEHFRTHSLKGFGVETLETAQVAAGALLHYMRETHKSSLNHLRRLYAYQNDDYMSLDGSTKRNLELSATLQEGGTDGTLVSILDYTVTAMGGRVLRKWITRPLKQLEKIQLRLNAVDRLYQHHGMRGDLRESLKEVGDLERMISRISVGRCSARDLKQLQLSLEQIPGIRDCVKDLDDPILNEIAGGLNELPDLQKLIDEAIVEDPPATLRESGIFRHGYREDLDELREIAKNGKGYITRIKNELAKETGISSLKIGYNKVFGYFIEVTNKHKDKVPETFIRKQTLVNCERYITPELKEVEEKVLSAEEKIGVLEAELFEELRTVVSGYTPDVQHTARTVARLDCLQGFAEVSFRNNYVKPEMNNGDLVDIKKGRHPVVERTLAAGEPFIPNDIRLSGEDTRIMIITGPNMAGKSIILRQTGLIVLMAQIGCFVPADSAVIGVVDKIFTRVGASDNLSAGESTFLVEMNEAANILNNATPDSLILLDEVGRGTSTFDGLSIAWSLVEYLHNNASVAAKTLFATHYHELNELENLYERISNYNVMVKEHNGKVIFLRKLVRGGADHSYGIQVADMAGLPAAVINRAREVLANLERHSLDFVGKESDKAEAGRRASEKEEKGSGATDRGEKDPDAKGSSTYDSGVTSPKNGSGSDGTEIGGGSDGTEIGGVTEPARKKQAARTAVKDLKKQAPVQQMALFQADLDPNLEMALDKLKAADTDRMTPMDALLLLNELKKLADS